MKWTKGTRTRMTADFVKNITYSKAFYGTNFLDIVLYYILLCIHLEPCSEKAITQTGDMGVKTFKTLAVPDIYLKERTDLKNCNNKIPEFMFTSLSRHFYNQRCFLLPGCV